MSHASCLSSVMYSTDTAQSPRMMPTWRAFSARCWRRPWPAVSVPPARVLPDLAIQVDQADGCDPILADEFADLVALLLGHRSHDGPEAEWLAHAIASGCLGNGHLYHDMGLPNRQALSDLLREHFTTLFERNVGNMKWKKFFYKQLCDQAEVRACRVCADYLACFGPEE